MNQDFQEVSIEVLQEKYCKGDESTIDDVQSRVAKAIAAVEDNPEEWEHVFLEAQKSGVVMAGRINSAAGTQLQATWINCFVQPVADSISDYDDDGYPGIYIALREATETMRRGGGVGYDFSRLRPRGAYVKSTHSESSGPVSYMHVFDRSCQTVESAGARRGAQMGMLRIDHPDIEEFIHAKDTGELTNFNISISVTDAFMRAVKADENFELTHIAEPSDALKEKDVFQREDGLWVYKVIKARDLWSQVMVSTYDHGEPGVFFIDRVNADNNLYYCETIEASNPCAEQCLPPYGCCCLGSINLAELVKFPFDEHRCEFDWSKFAKLIGVAVRMLDNVLDGTFWPLDKQREEAMAKRRIGLGFLGLGDALVVLGIRYDTQAGRDFAARITRTLRDEAYLASIELAKERGAFPLFAVNQYLSSGFAKRLPEEIQQAIREHGIRNSHLLSIAPTGTISLAFADNASNGIEPAFSWTYERRKRIQNRKFKTYEVEDHSYRVYRELGNDTDNLPEAFVSALEISALNHAKMVAVVQEYIDSSISKTVNIPVDYPFDNFQDLYMSAWESGTKSLATFRPNEVIGSILSVAEDKGVADVNDFEDSDPDRRIVLDKLPDPTLNSLRWPRRPDFPNGNPAHCYMVKHPHGKKFALFIGSHVDDQNKPYPFEVWVNGIEQPRGLNALAINLSYDMYAQDSAWLQKKLDSLGRCVADGEGFEVAMPPSEDLRYAPSIVAAMAWLIKYRCEELDVFNNIKNTPILDALMSNREPKTGANGTMSWTVDVRNLSAAGDDFVLGLKELVIYQDGKPQRRPYSIWLSGVYPNAFDGLCKALSLDMRVIDPAWIGKKLRELLNYSEPRGDFFAQIPGSDKQKVYPSTVAYIAQLVIHRFYMLGILDQEGYPIEPMGIVEQPKQPDLKLVRSVGAAEVMPGKHCRSCGAYAVIKVDGCDRCTACGDIGACG